MSGVETAVPAPTRRRVTGEMPLPREIQVEVTAACNLRCHMCLVRYRPPIDRLRGSLSLERFRAIIDPLPSVDKVTLQGLGEPLLVPDLVDMVRLAASRGARVGFNSNGTLLTREKATRLIDAGLTWLHVSLDGATAATHESIRDGANFERIVRNVAALMELRSAKRVDRPAVWLVFVAMRRNIAELPDVVRLAARLGVDGVRVQNLSHSFTDTDPGGEYRQIRSFTEAEALWLDASGDEAVPTPGRSPRATFTLARAVADATGVCLRLPEDEADGPAEDGTEPVRGCDWPWRATYVTHDAKVQPCCMVMGSDRATLGDLSVAPLAEIWNGPAYRRFRRQLEGDAPPAVCHGCAEYRRVF